MKRSLSAEGIFGVCEFVLSPTLDFRLNHPNLDSLLENSKDATINKTGEKALSTCPPVKISTPSDEGLETAVRY